MEPRVTSGRTCLELARRLCGLKATVVGECISGSFIDIGECI